MPKNSITYSHNQSTIPQELIARRQWVVWRYQDRRGSKLAKVPYNPTSGKKANVRDPHTWGTYDEACSARLHGTWDGVGYVLSDEDPYVVIDLDNCRNIATYEIEEWAQQIIERFDSYTEVSPSGRGVHIFIKGNIPDVGHKEGKVEVYDHQHFFTITGCGTGTIQVRNVELHRWHREVFHQHPQRTRSQPVSHASILPDLDDLIEQAKLSANGKKFSQLWEGDTSEYSSQSEADQALCDMLTFWTGGDAEKIDHLFRQSGLMRLKWDEQHGNQTYGERTIEAAINQVDVHYHPRRTRRDDKRITHIYPWQKREETQEERGGRLQIHAQHITERVRAHIEAKKNTPLVIASAPGIGKTHAVAELGKEEYNLAWIAERHAMATSVPALEAYRHIQGCTEKNCPDYLLHRELASLGYNTWPLHKKHACDYGNQHRAEGSAFYQVEHVPTAYPKKHDAAIVDELNLPRWLHEHVITPTKIYRARVAAIHWSKWTEKRLLEAVENTIIETEGGMKPLHGKALFDTLDRHCGGSLTKLVEELKQDQQMLNTRPTRPAYPTTVEGISELPPVITPHLLSALIAELPKWQKGDEWNSRIRISNGKEGWALRIIEPRRFNLGEDECLPLVVLDATADETIFSLLFGTTIEIEREEIDLPPHTQHIAVRTGKRYGKLSLTARKHKDEYQQRVIKELRYLLSKLDPDGTEREEGRVGLITYQDCVQTIGEALSIPEHRRGHFWAERGSNAFSDCTILLVVGTPIPNIGAVADIARALYTDDPLLIDETSDQGEDGKPVYRDERMQNLTDYLTRSELTQCAHRNRPLRYDGRIVVTLSAGSVDFLPVTEEITSLPDLALEGVTLAQKREECNQTRLEEAEQELSKRGEKVTRRSMEAELKKSGGKGIQAEKIAAYLQRRRANLE